MQAGTNSAMPDRRRSSVLVPVFRPPAHAQLKCSSVRLHVSIASIEVRADMPQAVCSHVLRQHWSLSRISESVPLPCLSQVVRMPGSTARYDQSYYKELRRHRVLLAIQGSRITDQTKKESEQNSQVRDEYIK